MWGTFVVEVYRQDDAVEVRDALESLLGPNSASGWASGGVYVFWNPDTREPLYVGIAGDLPERFAQHNGLRGSSPSGSKRAQIAKYFANECDRLGFTVLPLSSLSQPSTRRQRESLALVDRELIELNEALSDAAVDEIRALEGRMIALYEQQFHRPIRWNRSPGRVPAVLPHAADGTLATAVGLFDCLLQARKTIRGLADDPEAAMFEVHLHAARMLAVSEAILGGRGFSNDVLRTYVESGLLAEVIRDAIFRSGYLDQRNPVTVGPVLEAPEEGPAAEMT